MENNLPKLICIVGPTASGKSGLAIDIAKQFNGYVISADSRQLYRGMDIGTAKVTAKEMAGTPHFLIDITTPDRPLTLADVQRRIFSIVEKEKQRHPDRVPVLVGGTGLYVSAVIDHWLLPPGKPLPEMRKQWDQLSTDELLIELKKIDPEAAKLVEPGNPRRIIRALEITHASGQAAAHLKKKGPPLFKDILLIGLKLPWSLLDQRINQRVDDQIKAGLIEEVKQLTKRYSPDLPAMSGIGYREIGMYLKKEISRAEAIHLMKLHTRQYARRQIRWWKRDQRIKWISDPSDAFPLVETFLS